MSRILERRTLAELGALPAFPFLHVLRLVYELGARKYFRMRLRHCGKNVRFRPASSKISYHSVSLGSNVYIAEWAYINGVVSIGDNVLLGPMVHITDGYHRFDIPGQTIQASGPGERAPVVIADDCWIGAKATILRGVHVHEGAIVGAMSVVTRDVPPYSIVAGNPARPIRKRFTDSELLEHLTLVGNRQPELVVERRTRMLGEAGYAARRDVDETEDADATRR